MDTNCFYRVGEVIGMIPVVAISYVAIETAVVIQVIALPFVAVGEYIATGDSTLTEPFIQNIIDTPYHFRQIFTCDTFY